MATSRRAPITKTLSRIKEDETRGAPLRYLNKLKQLCVEEGIEYIDGAAVARMEGICAIGKIEDKLDLPRSDLGQMGIPAQSHDFIEQMSRGRVLEELRGRYSGKTRGVSTGRLRDILRQKLAVEDSKVP